MRQPYNTAFAPASCGGGSLLAGRERHRLHPSMPLASKAASQRALSHYAYVSPRPIGRHQQRFAEPRVLFHVEGGMNHRQRAARDDPHLVARRTPISQHLLPINYVLPGTASPTFRQYPSWRSSAPPQLHAQTPLQRARETLSSLEPADYFGSTLRVRD